MYRLSDEEKGEASVGRMRGGGRESGGEKRKEMTGEEGERGRGGQDGNYGWKDRADDAGAGARG